jgi:two-component system sensor histidine kinase HydH
VEGLKRLAASFSELARLPVPELTRVDLREVLDLAVDGFKGEEARILWERPEQPVLVDADRTLLRQALNNLLKNALEAMKETGNVYVSIARDGDRLQIFVDDEGPGWASEVRGKAADPYVTTKAEGTGLGLSLVHRTALQHGGSLELEDRPGGGARVILTLPIPGSRQEVS